MLRNQRHAASGFPPNSQPPKILWATAQTSYQLSTDGFPAYLAPVDEHLMCREVDYGQIVKVYGASREGEQRYSPAEVSSAEPHPILGLSDVRRICASHVERSNLTMRMHLRRLTRLTNAFSKKWANLKAALALYFAWYNFCRFTKRSACLPQWPLESRTIYSPCRNS